MKWVQTKHVVEIQLFVLQDVSEFRGALRADFPSRPGLMSVYYQHISQGAQVQSSHDGPLRVVWNRNSHDKK